MHRAMTLKPKRPLILLGNHSAHELAQHAAFIGKTLNSIDGKTAQIIHERSNEGVIVVKVTDEQLRTKHFAVRASDFSSPWLPPKHKKSV